MTGILSIPCTGPKRIHHLLPEATDATGRRIERCVWCDALFRMPPDDGGPRGKPVLAVDLMASNVAPIPPMLRTNPAPSLA